VLDAVRNASRRRNVPAATIALAWLSSRPGVVAPVIGATAEHHIADAMASLSIELSAAEHAALETPYLPRLVTDYS
jgi:aryl-alcohol dehydrogenase-like predicted oxidoreductase